MRKSVVCAIVLSAESKVLFQHDAEICFKKGERKDVIFNVPELKKFALCSSHQCKMVSRHINAEFARDDYTVEMDFKFTENEPYRQGPSFLFSFGCGGQSRDWCQGLNLVDGHSFKTPRFASWQHRCDLFVHGTCKPEDHQKNGNAPLPYDQLPDLYDMQYHHIASTYETQGTPNEETDDHHHFFLDGIKFTHATDARGVPQNNWRSETWDRTDTEIRIGSSKYVDQNVENVAYAEADFCVRNVRLHQGVLPSGGYKPEPNCPDELGAKLARYYNDLPASEKSALTADETIVCRQGWADDFATTYFATAIHGHGWTEEDCKAEAFGKGYAGWFYDWNPVWHGWCRVISQAALIHDRIVQHADGWTDWRTAHSCIDVTKIGANRRLSLDSLV